MSRLVLVAIVLAAGCSREPQDLRPFVAVSARYSLLQHQAPAPKPTDGKCSNCRGLGYLTDGTVRSQCPVCKGTGKAIAECKDGKCATSR